MGDYNQIDGVLTIPTSVGEFPLKRQINRWIKAQMEDWLELTARRRVSHLRKALGESEYIDNMNHVTLCSGAGKFRWGGEAFRLAMADLPGKAQFIVLLCWAVNPKSEIPPIPESQVWNAFMNEADAKILIAGLKQVTDTNPNFLHPPEVTPE